MTAQLRVLLAGGGTAGHIEPALAVGEALARRHGAAVSALGTTKGLETRIVPRRGLELHLIDPVPIPRNQPIKLAAVPFRLARSVAQARKVLRDERIDVLFGTGGYVAAPAYLAAKATGVPMYALEPNALAGMGNKLAARLGATVFTAVAGSGIDGDVVGIPVRPGLGEASDEEIAAARRKWGLDPERRTLLVTGGSQGARSINDAVLDARGELIDDGWQILHAYGPKNTALSDMAHYHGVAYLDDMASALAVADLTVCRSGAMTVAEVTASRLPAIYVPLPHGNGEQGRNSAAVVAAGGAVMVPDAELDGPRLVAEIRALPKADFMRAAMQTSGVGDVAESLADRIAFDLGVHHDGH